MEEIDKIKKDSETDINDTEKQKVLYSTEFKSKDEKPQTPIKSTIFQKADSVISKLNEELKKVQTAEQKVATSHQYSVTVEKRKTLRNFWNNRKADYLRAYSMENFKEQTNAKLKEKQNTKENVYFLYITSIGFKNVFSIFKCIV